MKWVISWKFHSQNLYFKWQNIWIHEFYLCTYSILSTMNRSNNNDFTIKHHVCSFQIGVIQFHFNKTASLIFQGLFYFFIVHVKYQWHSLKNIVEIICNDFMDMWILLHTAGWGNYGNSAHLPETMFVISRKGRSK